MKTTIELPNALLEDAKNLARREGTTLRALIEDALRRVLVERRKKSKFVMRDARFGGKGLTAEFREAGWEKIRDAIYTGRGG